MEDCFLRYERTDFQFFQNYKSVWICEENDTILKLPEEIEKTTKLSVST